MKDDEFFNPRLTTAGKRVRHATRGGEYLVVGQASVQAGTPLTDYDQVIVYRGENGQLWVRPIREFCDGRFDPIIQFLPTPPTAA